MKDQWYHRGPCCGPCGLCGFDEHMVWNDDVSPEIHVCAHGCDGTPWHD